MKNILLACVMALVFSYISSGIINLRSVKAQKGFIKKAVAALPKEKSNVIYSIIMLVYMLALAIVQVKIYEGNFCDNAKILAFASLLFPMAQIDRKYLRIPNKLIILGLIYRWYIFVFELIYFSDKVLSNIISELIAAAVVFVVLMLVLLVMKNGIGMGDIKFLMLMGIMLGMYRTAECIFTVMIITFFVSLYKLIIKKVDKKTEFAFGPLIAIGSAISLIVFGS